MKKKLLIIIPISILTIVLVCCAIAIYNNNKNNSVQPPWYDELLESEFNADIIVYGEEFDMKKVKCRRIDALNEETIGEFDGRYKALVVYDMNNQAVLTEEDLLFVKKCCEKQHLDLFYVGEGRFDVFKKLGFSGQGFDEDEEGFMYLGSRYLYVEPDISENYNDLIVHGLLRDGEIKSSKEIYTSVVAYIYHTAKKYVQKIQK